MILLEPVDHGHLILALLNLESSGKVPRIGIAYVYIVSEKLSLDK